MTEKFEKHFKELVKKVEQYLSASIKEEHNAQGEIYKAMNYSLLAGGKRLRPVLALATAELLGADCDEVMPFACALEMIHTHSLIHDDLPALDNDDLRRGRPTCHKAFGEAVALLAGDALLNKAFEVMAEAAAKMNDPAKGARIMQKVGNASGTEGMMGGQVADLRCEGKDITEDQLRYMYAKKTGALLKAPFLIAIEAAGKTGTDEERKLLEYSETIGLAFQIKDDVLDVVGDAKLLGKEPGRDAADGKTTFASLYGVAKCEKILEEMTVKATSIAKTFGEKGEFLREMAEYLLERNY